MAVLSPQVRYEGMNGPSSVAVRGPSLTHFRHPTSWTFVAKPLTLGRKHRGVAMQRREFITLVGSAAAAWPAMARAQQDRARRIGVLMGYAEADPDTQARMAAFKEGLDQLGWKDGRNVQITFRFGVGEMDRVRASAKQLVESNPDVIVCETTPTLKVLAQQTDSLPIVFVSVADPVKNGYVADLARPGGHITGFTNFEARSNSSKARSGGGARRRHFQSR
jgi:ABC transporter substrate binding protein